MMKREEIVKYVKLCGQEIIDRAEDLVGDGEFLSDFDIWITFLENNIPEIRVDQTYKSKKCIEYLMRDK